MGIENNSIWHNFIGAMKYEKSSNKDKNGDLLLNNETDDELCLFDLNNDGKVTKNEIKKSLFDINGDKKISVQDLEIYTTLINFFDEYMETDDNELTDEDFNTDNNEQLEDNKKALKSLLDSDNGDLFDEDILALISDKQKTGDMFLELLKDETEALDKKLNPNAKNDTVKQNKVFDAETGKLLSQEVINKGVKYTYEYTYNENGGYAKTILNNTTNEKTIYSYNEKNQLTKKETNTVPKSKEEYQYNKDGKIKQMTSVKTENGAEVKRTYDYTYNEDGSYTKTGQNHTTNNTVIYSYNEKNQLTKKEKITVPKSKKEYQYNKDGKIKKMTSVKTENGVEVKRTYDYTYNEDGSYTKTGQNHATNNTVVYSYDKDNKLTKKTITAPESKEEYQYNKDDKIEQMTSVKTENGVEVKRTYNYKYNDDGSYTKTEFDKTANEQIVYSYDKDNKLTEKEINTKDGNILTYNYLKYEGDYPKEYSVEYNYANGIHTKSYITQRKLEKSDNDYIESSRNYQLINEGNDLYEERLIFTLETGNVTDSDGIKHEGTHRTAYFYNENGELTKTEYTESYNAEEKEGKPIRTNDYFQLQNKVVTTFNPDTKAKTSEVRYDENNIITTYYNASGTKIKSKKVESYKENSYGNHNLKGVSREDIIAEAKKYKKYNRLDGSYSLFGTNGSACASFATFIMYQLGFDLTSLGIRNTLEIKKQAKNEGRYTDAKDVFELVRNGEAIESIVKPGDLYTSSKGGPGTGSHTTIVKSAKYDKQKDAIILEVIGYESNNSNNGIKERKYILTQNSSGNIVKNNSVRDTGFVDFISTQKEIAQKKKI